MKRAWGGWVVVLFVVAGVSGCVEPNESGSDRVPASRADPVRGHMTSHEVRHRWVGACPGQSTGGPLASAPVKYCGTSAVYVEGEIDLRELPVILETVNGNVVLEFSRGPDWNLTLLATASSKDSFQQAQETIDNFAPSWSHEEDGGHFLRAEARVKTRTCSNTCPKVSIALRAPDNLFVRADLSATNGAVEAGGHQYSHLVATSTNGKVVLRDSITRDVVLRTTNGQIEIRSRPYESGLWRLGTTNGGVVAWVPEDARIGYDASGTTTNGAVVIGLRDGVAEGSARSKSFRTTGYENRPVQVRIDADTTNGDVSIGPV